MDHGIEIGQNKNPQQYANFCSKLFYWWMNPLLWHGWRNEVRLEDIPKVRHEDESKSLSDSLQNAWLEEVKKRREKAKLVNVLYKLFRTECLWIGFWLFLRECFVRILQTLCMSWLITSFAEDKAGLESWFNGCGFVVTGVLVSVMVQDNFANGVNVGMRVRTAVSSLIYAKSLRIMKMNNSLGKTVNMLANDVTRVELFCYQMHYLWVAPLQLIMVVVFTWNVIGPSTLAGAVLILVFAAIQSKFGMIFSRLRQKTAKKSDKRISLMGEIINGIKVIKMYTWEKPFAGIISQARKEEIDVIRKSTYYKAFNMGFFFVSHRVIMLAILSAYVMIEGKELDPSDVYLTLGLYFIVRLSMARWLPQSVSNTAECHVSLRRIQDFLELEELKLNDTKFVTTKGASKLTLSDVSVHWRENGKCANVALNDVSLNLQSSKLLAVIGAVGSGKSTLLHAILGELPVCEGKIELGCTKIGFAAQEPWIFSSTVRQNIVFDQSFDVHRYSRVIEATALNVDIESWEDGDETLVGDRGIILSGGQKARINLARCIYRDADVYLLDDPLSAVDANVGRHIYESCIRGFLKEKAILLVTHQVHYLKDADEILVMKQGKISSRGTFCQLKEIGEVDELISTENEKPQKTNKRGIFRKTKQTKDKKESKGEKQSSARPKLQRPGFTVYRKFFKAGGNIFTWPVLLCLHIGAQCLFTTADIFLGYWVNHSGEAKDLDFNRTYMLVYTGLILGSVFFSILRTVFHYVVCLKSTENLHNAMFTKILHTNSRFFDVNPVGRILNRFSKDLGAVDELLPTCMFDVISIFGTILGTFAATIYYKPILLLPTLVNFVIFYYLRNYFIESARPIKMLEGSTKAPVFSQLFATFNGLVTIRASQAERRLQSEFDKKQDLHNSTYFLFQNSARWFGTCLDCMGIAFLAICVFAFLLINDSTLSGDIGVVLSSCLMLVGGLQFGMRQSAEMETWMTSVERIMEYGQLEDEEDDHSFVKADPPVAWPHSGAVQFFNVSLRYERDGNLALKGLTFNAEAGEKIGIVGRTGAGKSSMITALLRLVKSEGKIFIDRIDVSKITLEHLRKNISIIPQDPLLFNGTLRKNLDPFNDYKDDEIWTALKQVQLHDILLPEAATGTNATLDSVKVTEGGSNFSVGQRQLLCLARAILKRNKILVMDEATANVDPKTDEIIQRTIRERFAECTILTIAHRLHTVLDSDKILVLSKGQMIEFGSPEELLENVDGGFRKLMNSIEFT